jgi:uroporphyrin-III C-methyltransferase
MDEAASVWPVAIVGAGPGDPELLTLRAARLIGAADVILHDRLLDPRVLALASEDARLIDVGKDPGGPRWEQRRINELLVLFALAGHRVVRLKSGDPFVFGRGREEADALEAAGVPWQVVPGVSSAIAAPAAVGIPVTHRAVAASFTVVTASRAEGEPDPDWDALARLSGTIVVLMGAARRGAIAAALMDAGMAADTPVAAVIDATHETQAAVVGTLAELGDLPVRNPAVIVIGDVAAYGAAPAWEDGAHVPQHHHAARARTAGDT